MARGSWALNPRLVVGLPAIFLITAEMGEGAIEKNSPEFIVSRWLSLFSYLSGIAG
jgi:hypothetical protein